MMSSLRKRKRRSEATSKLSKDQDKERASGDEEEGSAYQQLLISLASRRRKIQQRKVGHSGIAVVADGHSDGASSHAVCEESEETDGNPASEAEEDSDHGHMSEKEGGESEWESDDESGKETRDHFPSVKDPFSEHLDPVLTPEEVAMLEAVTFSLSPPSQLGPLGLVCRWPGLKGREPQLSYHSFSLSELHVKQKLAHNWKTSKTTASFSELQRHLFSLMNSYVDVLYTQRTFENAEEIRRVYVLHVLNHVLKTRSRVLRNNHKLLQASKDGRHIEEPRDQGLTRPKVLILLPFRHSALQVVNAITSLLIPTGQGHVHNNRRFHREFHDATGSALKVPKPSSYTSMFAGNTDDCFKVGVALQGKVVRLYADFYSSDIILASPLGLRTIIGVEGEKRDFDFLSSLELLVLDQTDIFLLQNWEHLTHVLSHLHLRPRESHGVDFSRVRLWTLNEWSSFYRQTLIFSSLQTPEINSLLTTYCHNYAGGVRCDCDDKGETGSMGQVVRQLPQVFTRLNSPSFSQLPDSRLHHLTAQVLPNFHGDLMKGTLIFIPSYFDFVRLRNYMKKQELSFTAISEYTSSSGVVRARTQFYQGLKHFLLYTERAHFFRRYRLRGVHHALFYSLPTYPEHYSDIVNMVEGEEGTVEVLHSCWDQLALVRIVGSARAKHMISSTDSIHMLVTSHRQ